MKQDFRRIYNTAWMIPACFIEKKIPRVSPEILERIQRRRLKRIVRHAWDHVPFYREAMRKTGLLPSNIRKADDLSFLPLVSNAEIMSNPGIFSSETTNYDADMLLHSGNYKSIYWDGKAALQWFARLTRSREVINKLLGKSSGYTELYITPMNSCNQRMNEYWGDSLYFRGRAAARLRLDMKKPYNEIVDQLNSIKPDIVLTFGSYLENLWRYVEHNKLSVHHPRIWYYGSDMLSGETRKYMEDRYGCMVYSAYSMNEMGGMAFECENRNGFHLNTDACHVRIVNEEGENVPVGETGEIVVSNLVNRSTVILNYRTGDRGRMSRESCSCGRTLPLLRDLYGRINDTVYLADGSAITFGLLDSLVNRVFRDVSAYQIVQDRPGHIRWRLVPFPGCDREEAVSGTIDLMAGIVSPDNRIEVEWAEQLEVTPGRKRRAVIHRFPTGGNLQGMERNS